MAKSGMQHLSKVWEIQTLNKSRKDECRALLQKVADQVAPIMERRGWRVQVLAEFFPKDPGLLGMNVNRGEKIMIRMRPAHSPDTFYPFEHLLGTMLHELAHMEIGPHNDAFQALWDKLWEEAEDLMSKGITGSSGASGPSFSGKGQALGGQKVSRAELNSAIAKAAEKRARVQGMMTSGGVRLGGSTCQARTKEERRQLIRAAMQRRGLGGCCGVVSGNIAVRTETKAPRVPVAGAKKRPAYDWKCNKCTLLNSSNFTECSVCGSTYELSKPIKLEWECTQCTLRNDEDTEDCVICGLPRNDENAAVGVNLKSPAPVIRQAPAPVISQAPAPVINWECTMCTFENQHARAYCEVCNTPKQRAAGTGEGTKIPCSVCTYVNSSAHVFCEICQNPLHSEGNAGGLNVDFTSRTSEPWTCSVCTEHQDGTMYFCKFCGSAQPDETRNSAPMNIPTYSRTEGPKWQCSACTIENSPNFLECQTCRTRRPNQAQSTGDEIDLSGIY